MILSHRELRPSQRGTQRVRSVPQRASIAAVHPQLDSHHRCPLRLRGQFFLLIRGKMLSL